MANTLARCTAQDKSGRIKSVTRTGSEVSTGCARTQETVAECHVWDDGHGYLQVKRTGSPGMYYHFPFGPETGMSAVDQTQSEIDALVTALENAFHSADIPTRFKLLDAVFSFLASRILNGGIPNPARQTLIEKIAAEFEPWKVA